MQDTYTTRQIQALKKLKEIIGDVSIISSNDAFISGSGYLVAAQVALMKAETAWQSEHDHIRSEL